MGTGCASRFLKPSEPNGCKPPQSGCWQSSPPNLTKLSSHFSQRKILRLVEAPGIANGVRQTAMAAKNVTRLNRPGQSLVLITGTPSNPMQFIFQVKFPPYKNASQSVFPRFYYNRICKPYVGTRFCLWGQGNRY